MAAKKPANALNHYQILPAIVSLAISTNVSNHTDSFANQLRLAMFRDQKIRIFHTIQRPTRTRRTMFQPHDTILLQSFNFESKSIT
jgi:hypothetical protein